MVPHYSRVDVYLSTVAGATYYLMRYTLQNLQNRDNNSNANGGNSARKGDRGTRGRRRSSWIGCCLDTCTERMGRHDPGKKAERRGFRDSIMYAHNSMFCHVQPIVTSTKIMFRFLYILASAKPPTALLSK